MQKQNRIHQYLIGLLTCLGVMLLTSCATTKPSLPTKFHPQALMQQSAQSYLDQAHHQTGRQAQQSRLNAVAVLLINDHNNAAHQILNHFDEHDLQGQQQAFYYVLNAFFQLNINQPHKALQALQKVNQSKLIHSNRTTRLLYHQIALLCYQRNQKNVRAIKQSIAVSQLNDNQNKKWLNDIWIDLQRLSVNTLSKQSKATTGNLHAWFQLALIIRHYNTSPPLLAQHIKQWQSQHPQHPGNQLLPNNLSANNMANYQPQHIAILLPQSGQYEAMGEAVRNGLLTAIKQNQPQVDISFYDTAQKPIEQTYQQAVQQGADLVIGPLTRPHVKALMSQTINIPTIALNYTSYKPESPYLLEFGLSPQQSAQQSADSAWKRGANNFLVIQSKGSWYNNITQAFKQRIHTNGGNINDQIKLQQDDTKLQIAQALNVNQSQVRAHYIRNILREKPIYTPRRRQDIKGIFLLAPPDQARQVNPLIKFYYAGDLPIYSSALINDDQNQPHKNSDLDPIHFSDLRWILNSHHRQLKQRMKSNWPNNYDEFRRLYAIGYDALTIATHINYFNKLPYCIYPGVSGPLYAHKQKIYQLLALGRFHNGQVKFISE